MQRFIAFIQKFNLSALKIAFILSGPLLFSLPTFAQNSQRERPTKLEKKQLKKWGGGKTKRANFGTVLTPPIGKVQSDVSQVRAYVQNVVDRLYGAQLKADHINLVVNIYAGNSFNAFMGSRRRTDPAEKNWTQYHESTWPIRKFLGFDGNGNPIYELAVLTGFLRQIEFEEELAFVLAHEITHLKEGHADERKIKKQLWRAQSNEVVADHEAIDLMVGHYDLDGVLLALNRMASLREDEDELSTLAVGIISGVNTHHHEGVRISAAGSYIEFLRRTNIDAQIEDLHPLPDYLNLKIPGRDGTPGPDLPQARRLERAIVRKYLLPHKSMAWMNLRRHEDLPPEVLSLSKLGAPPEEQLKAFIAGFEEIEKSKVSPSDKVDTFLKLVLFFNNYQVYWGAAGLTQLDVQSQQRIAHFLQENSSGPKGWKEAKSKLAKDLGLGNATYKLIYEHIFKSHGFQALIKNLVKVNAEWNHFLDRFPQYAFYYSVNSKNSLIALGTHYSDFMEEDPTEMGPLDLELQHRLLAYIQKAPLEEWAAEGSRYGPTNFSNFVKEIYSIGDKVKNHDAERQIKAILDPLLGKFQRANEQSLLAKLDRQKNEKVLSLPDDLFPVFGTPDHPPSDEFLRKAEPGLIVCAQQMAHDPQYAFSTSRLPVNKVAANRLELFLANRLESDSTSEQEKFDIIHFFAKAQGFAQNTPSGTEIIGKITSYLSSLSPEKMTDLLSERTPIFDGIITNLKVIHPNIELSDEGLSKAAKKIKPIKFSDLLKDPTHKLRLEITMAAELEANYQLSILTLLGEDKNATETFAKNFSMPETRRIIDVVYKIRQRNKDISMLAYEMGPKTGNQFNLSSQTGMVLLDCLKNNIQNFKSVDEWYDLYSKVIDISPMAIEMKGQYRDIFENFLAPKVAEMGPSEVLDYLKKDYVLNILKAETTASLLVKSLERRKNEIRDDEQLNSEVENINQGLQLEKEYPEAYKIFKQDLAQTFNLQPRELPVVFSKSKTTASERANVFSGEIRGLSAIVGATRNESIDAQIQMLEFLMGRRPNPPEFITEINQKLEVNVPFLEIVRNLRSRLAREEISTRILVCDAFLAGPTSFIQTPIGKDQLISHLLTNVRPQNQRLAMKLANALLDAQGRVQSLAFAYVLGQKGHAGQNQALNESEVLSSLFDAYGTPGGKWKQYIGFTAGMAEHREVFEEAQDNFLPLSYYDAVDLVRQRFGDNWPEKYRIVKVKGSGTVNIGIEYFNAEKGQYEIANIARENIEAETTHNFNRFNKFLESLTATPEDREEFGYLLGLSNIIQKSVTLEFDKEHAFNMYKAVRPIYNRKVKGWNVQTVDVYSVENMTIFMQKAPGLGAKKLKNLNPALYKSAMEALSRVEFDALLGIGPDGNPTPVPLHANPDFHDGQVFIDPSTFKITIIDFGQAVPITNDEREVAIDLLRIISKRTDSIASATRLLNQSMLNVSPSAPLVTEDELRPILEKSERMDVFVRLLSFLEMKGVDVPLSSVHWILGMNRQLELGEKIGSNIPRKVMALLLSQKIGLPLSVYNRGHSWLEAVRNWNDDDQSIDPGIVNCVGLMSELGK